MKIIYSLIIASLIVIGCNEDSTANIDTTSTVADTTNLFLPTASAPLTLDTTPKLPALDANPVENKTTLPPAVNTPPKTTSPATNSAGVKLNPAHGQPGHDCAIPVGQPLNGSAAKTNSPAINVQPAATKPVVTPSPVLPAANTAGVKLNPAHGQPGHDCAIPVGQPLKNQ